MLPNTVDRVPRQTRESINRQIQADTSQSVRWHSRHPSRIEGRLKELDREWDIERTLEANASTLVLCGVALAATVDKRWLILPGVVSAFLLQHALQGWCPPLPILRGFGFRTAGEIETERNALKALRGDFGRLASDGERNDRASHAFQAARL